MKGRSRFNFIERVADDRLLVRFPKGTRKELEKIAKDENTTLSEITRVFLKVGYEEYNRKGK